MKNRNVAIASICALLGISGAVASQAKAIMKPAAVHNWVDESGNPVLTGTTAQAEAECPGTGAFCLRANDASNIIVQQQP